MTPEERKEPESGDDDSQTATAAPVIVITKPAPLEVPKVPEKLKRLWREVPYEELCAILYDLKNSPCLDADLEFPKEGRVSYERLYKIAKTFNSLYPLLLVFDITADSQYKDIRCDEYLLDQLRSYKPDVDVKMVTPVFLTDPTISVTECKEVDYKNPNREAESICQVRKKISDDLKKPTSKSEAEEQP